MTDETKAVFEEKQAEINRQITKLQDERAALAATFERVVISDKTIQTIEKVAADVKLAFPNATFEEKRALVEMLDVRGMIKQVDKRKSLLEITCVLDDKSTKMIGGFYQNRGKKGKMNLQQLSEGSSPCPPLHKRIADRRADELETARFQILAHRIRLLARRGNFFDRFPLIVNRFAIRELPNIFVERTDFLLHGEETLRVRNRRCDL